jgi:sulfotransferase family protein
VPAAEKLPRDLADEAMLARAHQRFAADRRRASAPRKGGALPNLVVIGGLKCGTTSLHHYLSLHPEIAMSRPKELNFFVAELNHGLGADWYARHFEPAAKVRGETSPHYTARPRLEGVAGRMRELIPGAKLIYAVRDPIERLLSHYLHNVGGGYESRSLDQVLGEPSSAYVDRSRYAYQLEPYLEAFGPGAIAIVTQDELRLRREETMRELFAFLGVDAEFTSPEFEREWETGSAKGSSGFRLMDRAVRLPGLRAVDRAFDRLPESLRWRVERIVHDPDAGEAAKPELSQAQREALTELFVPDVGRLEEIAGRQFGWLGEA